MNIGLRISVGRQVRMDGHKNLQLRNMSSSICKTWSWKKWSSPTGRSSQTSCRSWSEICWTKNYWLFSRMHKVAFNVLIKTLLSRQLWTCSVKTSLKKHQEPISQNIYLDSFEAANRQLENLLTSSSSIAPFATFWEMQSKYHYGKKEFSAVISSKDPILSLKMCDDCTESALSWSDLEKNKLSGARRRISTLLVTKEKSK